MRHEMPDPRKAHLASASSDSERTFSVPAEVPAAILTFCLTGFPASTRVSLDVSLAASSPAKRTGPNPVRPHASGPGRVPTAGPTALAARFPTTLSQPQGEGGRETLHAGAYNFRPGPESR